MLEVTFLGIRLFVFIFSCLLVLKNLYSFVKVLAMKQGKFEQSKYTAFYLGCAISYIITTLIIGF